MTKPDDIPQDVWDAAEDAFDTLLCNDIQASGTAAQFRIDSITPVARAILAERERCARLADPVEPRGDWHASAYEKQAYDLRVNIAASIRGAA